MNKKVKSVLSVVITGGLLMTYGGAAFANSLNSTTTTPSTQTKQAQVHPGRPGQLPRKGQGPMENDPQQMKTMLATFVADGTLTQAKVDNILAFMATKAPTPPQPKPDLFSQMVASGIITQAQADTIKAKTEAQRLATRQAEQKTQLSALVTNNTLTATQVDQILAFEVKEDAARKTERDKVKAMTAEQRDAYLKTTQSAPKGPLAGIVTAGILTQAQADAVAKVMRPAHPGSPLAGPKENDQVQMKTTLAALVTDGTLTQAKVDSMTAFMATKAPTPPQPKPDLFSQLVASGIITQAQADTIKTKTEAQRLATRQSEQKTRLNTLVTNNTLTTAQVDQILAFEVKEDAARKAERDKVKAMTAEQRDAYLKTTQSAPKGPLAGIVEAGILTQAQADAVAKVMDPRRDK